MKRTVTWHTLGAYTVLRMGLELAWGKNTYQVPFCKILLSVWGYMAFILWIIFIWCPSGISVFFFMAQHLGWFHLKHLLVVRSFLGFLQQSWRKQISEVKNTLPSDTDLENRQMSKKGIFEGTNIATLGCFWPLLRPGRIFMVKNGWYRCPAYSSTCFMLDPHL